MKMQKLPGLLAAALCLTFASANSAAVAVSIEGASDSHEGTTLFDSSGIIVTDNGLTNMIELGLNDFEAVTDALLAPAAAFDTVSMEIVAPTGYVITGIQFVEEVTYAVDNGFVYGFGSLEANDLTSDLGATVTIVNSGSATGDGTFDSGLIDLGGVSSVDVSVTNSLTAAILGEAGTGGPDTAFAEIIKTAAYFEVTLEAAPVPLPPAAWLMGSALLGLLTVRRNKNNA